MDVLTIILSARHTQWWLYYAVMATLGSVIGGLVTYVLGRQGGKETLARKFPRAKLEKVYKIFGRWGFGAIVIPALLPPPVPMVPFLFTAGALRYSVNKFLIAMTLGRIVRYSILAYLGARYGRHMLADITQLPHPILITAIALAIAAIVVFTVIFRRKREKSAAA